MPHFLLSWSADPSPHHVRLPHKSLTIPSRRGRPTQLSCYSLSLSHKRQLHSLGLLSVGVRRGLVIFADVSGIGFQYEDLINRHIDTAILSRYILPKEASTYTKAQPNDKCELRGTLSSSAHHRIELMPSSSKRFIEAFTRASQAQVIASHQIESPSNTSPTLAGIRDMITCSRKSLTGHTALRSLFSLTQQF